LAVDLSSLLPGSRESPIARAPLAPRTACQESDGIPRQETANAITGPCNQATAALRDAQDDAPGGPDTRLGGTGA